MPYTGPSLSTYYLSQSIKCGEGVYKKDIIEKYGEEYYNALKEKKSKENKLEALKFKHYDEQYDNYLKEFDYWNDSMIKADKSESCGGFKFLIISAILIIGLPILCITII